MSTLINIASYPKCAIEFTNDKGYFQSNDEIRGNIIITTPIEGQVLHYDGIKISLVGIVGKHNQL